MSERLVSIQFSETESGMAEHLVSENGVFYRIVAIPTTETLNIDDVFEARTLNGKPSIGNIVYRRYNYKTVLKYVCKAQLDKLVDALEQFECKTGVLPGFLLVAHNIDVNPIDISISIGIPQKVEVEHSIEEEIEEK